jgi:hypothetical protein
VASAPPLHELQRYRPSGNPTGRSPSGCDNCSFSPRGPLMLSWAKLDSALKSLILCRFMKRPPRWSPPTSWRLTRLSPAKSGRRVHIAGRALRNQKPNRDHPQNIKLYATLRKPRENRTRRGIPFWGVITAVSSHTECFSNAELGKLDSAQKNLILCRFMKDLDAGRRPHRVTLRSIPF